MKHFSSSIQLVISKCSELTVQRIAVKIVVDQTMTATTSMALVFSVAMMDIKEKDARVVSSYYTLNPFPLWNSTIHCFISSTMKEKKHILFQDMFV